MADKLVETDVEKAGKGLTPKGGSLKLWRSLVKRDAANAKNMASGKTSLASGLRMSGRLKRARSFAAARVGVKKSGEPSALATLDSAIEKARGLIPRGGSSRLANRLARQGAKLRDKGGDPKAVKRFAALGTLANRKKGNSIGLGYEPGKGYKSLLRRGKYK